MVMVMEKDLGSFSNGSYSPSYSGPVFCWPFASGSLQDASQQKIEPMAFSLVSPGHGELWGVVGHVPPCPFIPLCISTVERHPRQ